MEGANFDAALERGLAGESAAHRPPAEGQDAAAESPAQASTSPAPAAAAMPQEAGSPSAPVRASASTLALEHDEAATSSGTSLSSSTSASTVGLSGSDAAASSADAAAAALAGDSKQASDHAVQAADSSHLQEPAQLGAADLRAARARLAEPRPRTHRDDPPDPSAQLDTSRHDTALATHAEAAARTEQTTGSGQAGQATFAADGSDEAAASASSSARDTRADTTEIAADPALPQQASASPGAVAAWAADHARRSAPALGTAATVERGEGNDRPQRGPAARPSRLASTGAARDVAAADNTRGAAAARVGREASASAGEKAADGPASTGIAAQAWAPASAAGTNTLFPGISAAAGNGQSSITGASGSALAAANPGSPLDAASSLPPFSAQLSAPLDSPAFAPALGVQISMFARHGIGHALLNLNPAELGPVEVRIELDGQQAEVRLAAEWLVTRDKLEQALPTLASSLLEAGFQMSEGSVSQQTSAEAQAQPQGQSQGQANGDGQASTGMAGRGNRSGNPATQAEPTHSDTLAPLARQGRTRGMLDVFV
jgi:flagellar hook-length control protein FliK